ncbi:hypothetical protein RVR_5975 [Actinacidiphila reveromycinica]|uniref:DUF3558 domain-containing protein n=1 Tax=Actinacidiphila reveromycinica TaxID=659352 RepID=A0A7U3VQ41_9ACTN|nr:DUF3558 domain-containing protein [Streptomyces sp. SN-593]BBA99380.1 hypothetical protein RVR_5975 [Streptomyces sp. SN-593]
MERRRRPSKRRLAVLLAGAAVPALLVAGCSSGSGGSSGSDSDADGGKDGSASAAPSATTTPPLAPARFTTLPSPCSTVTKDTVTKLVPKAKHSGGTATDTADTGGSRSGCSWTGNGTDGFQYRWLSVSLERYDSSAALGAADLQAHQRFTDAVSAAEKTAGTTATGVTGVGDEARSISGWTIVSKVKSQNDSVVVRTGNVVVLVEYDGAGLEGKKNPSAKTVDGDAQQAAKDVVAAIAAANA